MMSAKRARTGSREADLALGTTLHRASGKPAGELAFGGVHLPYTPLSGDPRQPTARRTSPAHLFVGSLGASYALTLAQRLDAAALPWCSLDILSEASLVSTSGALRFDTIMVRATVAGADTVAGSAYRQVAKEARDRCPLARSIRGNVAYKLGEVLVVERVAGASTRHPIGPFRG